MKLVVVRHGEAVDDIEDCFGGMADFELTDAGRAQAVDASKQIAEQSVKFVFTSPLKRAAETARIISSELGLPEPVVVDDIQERNSYGVLSGVNKDRAKELFPTVFANLKEKPGYSDEAIPGYESWDKFVPRVRRGFDQIIDYSLKHQFHSICIVTHGKFTQALLRDVLGIERDVYLQLSALNVVDYEPPQVTLNE